MLRKIIFFNILFFLFLTFSAFANTTVGFEKKVMQVIEQSRSLTIPVILSADVTPTVVVDYTITAGTATSGSDYSASSSGNVSFTGTSISEFVSVSISSDSITEDVETFTITLSNPVNATLDSSATTMVVRIIDPTKTNIGEKDTIATFEKVQHFGVTGNGEEAEAIIGDSNGVVYIGGHVHGNFALNPSDLTQQTTASNGGLFVSKFNNDSFGKSYVLTASGDSPRHVSKMRIDANGNLFVVGDHAYTMTDSGNTQVFSDNGSPATRVFLLKLNSSLERQMNLSFAPTAVSSTAYPNDMRVASDGSIYITGAFSGNVDFDPQSGVQNKTASGSNSFFILKLNSAGELLWFKSSSGTGQSDAVGLAIDSSGHIYVAGAFSGTIDFGNGSKTAAGGFDSYLMKLDSNGNIIWLHTMGSTGNDYGNRLEFNQNNELIFTYDLGGRMDLDPSSSVSSFLSNSGNVVNLSDRNADTIISKFTTDGILIWAKAIQTTSTNTSATTAIGAYDPKDLAVDSLGFIYIGGRLTGAADVDPSETSEDIRHSYPYTNSVAFLSRFNTNGGHNFTKVFGGMSNDFTRAIFVNSSRELYGVGTQLSSAVDYNPSSTASSNVSLIGSEDAFIVKYKQRAESGVPLEFVRHPVLSVGGRVKIWVNGGTFPLSYSISPESVAKIENGKIVGVSAGSFSLIVTDSIGDSVSMSGIVYSAKSYSRSFEIGEFRSASDFKMVSFPFHHQAQGFSFLKEKLMSPLGSMGTENFMIYAYKNSDYFDLTTSSVSVENGRGYWMATLDAKTFSMSANAPYLDEVIEVLLDQGWQMIGNPYNYAIPVSSIYVSTLEGDGVISANEDTISATKFWYYNNSKGVYEAVTSIQPGQAVWVYIRQSGGAKLYFVVDSETIAAANSTNESSYSESLQKSSVISRDKIDENEPLPPAPPGGFSSASASLSGGGCLFKRQRI